MGPQHPGTVTTAPDGPAPEHAAPDDPAPDDPAPGHPVPDDAAWAPAPVPPTAAPPPPAAPPSWRDRAWERRARSRRGGRRWGRLALLGTVLVLVGAAGGLGVAALTPPVYAAHADVLYLLTREQPTGFLREDRNLSTQLVVLRSRTVLGPVADAWQLPVEDLTDAVDATVLQDSEAIEITLRDGDPDHARGMLEAVVARYLEVSNNDERAQLRAYLDDQLRDVLARKAAVTSEGPARTAEVGPLEDREQWLRRQLDELRLADLAGPAARVLVPPYVAADPVRPRPLLMAGAGALAGLVVALSAVAVLTRRPRGGP